MQHRMKEFTLSPEKIDALLRRAPAGRLSTIGEDGYPYTVSVHFFWDGQAVYFHGLPQGQKLDNLRRCGKVCFEVSELTAILKEGIPSPCKADAAYESVVLTGDAALLTEPAEKRAVLDRITEKYVPEMAGFSLPDNMVAGTAVVKITPKALTGKYHV